jgi:hypothetical protein
VQPAPPAIIQACRESLNRWVREPDDPFSGKLHLVRVRLPGEPIDKTTRYQRQVTGDVAVQCGYDSRGRFYALRIPVSLVRDVMN